MRRAKMIVAIAGLCVVMSSVEARAATIAITLVRTSGLTNVNDAFSTVQLDAGDVVAGGVVVGHFVREKRTAPTLGINEAALRITVFVSGSGEPSGTVVMQGAHSFNSGGEKGGISAVPAEFAFLQSATFSSPDGDNFVITF